MAAKKRAPLTAQQRVKRSQNAKKRIRGVNGRFLDGIRASGAMSAAQDGRKKPYDAHTPSGSGDYLKPKVRNKSLTNQEIKEVGTQSRSDSERLVRSNPKRAAEELAYRRTRDITGSQNVRQFDIEHAPTRTTSSASTEGMRKYREKNWDKPGVYKTSSKKTPAEFEKQMSDDHRSEVDRLARTPGSPLTKGLDEQVRSSGSLSPGIRRRRDTYLNKLQEGHSHQEALDYVGQEHRGRKPSSATKTPRKTGQTRPAADRSRRGKYDSSTPKGSEMQFGVSAKAVDKVSDLKDRFPDATDRELVQMQQAQRESIYGDFLHNQKWAHETKRANILGDKSDSQEGESDRVVFFTTSAGGPSPSVPSDSLVGQYIIRKRKDMMKGAGVPNSQLRGEFPRAVRDMHIFEWSTGVSYGIQGEEGLYKQTGFRNRNQTSRGFGKPRPLGSQILTGSDGRPVYDNNGNIRYGDGATRRVSYQTPNIGLRIFIG